MLLVKDNRGAGKLHIRLKENSSDFLIHYGLNLIDSTHGKLILLILI